MNYLNDQFIFVRMQCHIGISCYSSANCEEVDGVAPIIVTSQEECCLQSPFQPRSFEVPLTSVKNSYGLQCAQCIGKENHSNSGKLSLQKLLYLPGTTKIENTK